MLNFLRNLRRQEMKGTKYLKYAIGEIILVMIGILLALSINNWNEKRKDKIIEDQILDEMIISLNNDRSIFLMLERRLVEKDSAIQTVLNLREEENLPKGSSFGGLIGAARQTIVFTYDMSPYESLVALGINKMSNKKLLNAINTYYTQDLPRSVEFLEYTRDRYFPMMQLSEKNAIEKGLLKKVFIKRDGIKWSVQYQSDPNLLLDDPMFYESLVVDFQYMENSLARLRGLIRSNKRIIDILEE